MKRNIFLLLAVLLLGGLLGCSNNNAKTIAKSKSYSFKEAISKGDVVHLNKVYNYEKFDRFIINVGNKIPDSIRTDTCSNLTSEDVQDEIHFTISGCTKNDLEMSYFFY